MSFWKHKLINFKIVFQGVLIGLLIIVAIALIYYHLTIYLLFKDTRQNEKTLEETEARRLEMLQQQKQQLEHRE